MTSTMMITRGTVRVWITVIILVEMFAGVNSWTQMMPTSCNDWLNIASYHDPAVTLYDGLYTIEADGQERQVYCDMSCNGGGWTLLVTAATPAAFSTNDFLELNVDAPSLEENYSILNLADVIKSESTGGANVQYRLESFARGRYGGIWEVPYSTTFTSSAPDQTSTLLEQFDQDWTVGYGSIQDRVPWIDNVNGILTTSDLLFDSWWGTLAMAYDVTGGDRNFDPSPWIQERLPQPGIIWYWMREETRGSRLSKMSDRCGPGIWLPGFSVDTTALDGEPGWCNSFGGNTCCGDFTADGYCNESPSHCDGANSRRFGLDVSALVTFTSNSTECLISDEIPPIPSSEPTETNISLFLDQLDDIILTSDSEDIVAVTQAVLNVAGEMLEVIQNKGADLGKQDVRDSHRIIEAIDEFTERVATVLPVGTTIQIETENIELTVISLSRETLENGWSFDGVRRENDTKVVRSSNRVSVDGTDLESLLDNYGNGDNDTLVIAGVLYKSVPEILGGSVPYAETDRGKTFVTSDIISLSVSLNGHAVSIPVTFQLQSTNGSEFGECNTLEEACGFLDFMSDENKYVRENAIWRSEGCTLTNSTNEIVECHCTHTTNFAVLMTVVPIEIPFVHQKILDLIVYIGSSVSIVSIIITFTLYIYLGSSLSSERMTIHKNLMAAIFIVQILVLCSDAASIHLVTCKLVAILLHYFCTSLFLWMLVEGVHLYRQIVTVYGSEKTWMKYYYAACYGLPAILVGICLAVRWNDYGSDGRGNQENVCFAEPYVGWCWLSAENGLIWAFAAIAITIILANIIVLGMVVKVVITAAKMTQSKDYGHAKAGVKSALMLLPLLGSTWLLGLFAVDNNTLVFLYLFAILNSLQGLFVVLFHFVFNSEVRAVLRRKLDKRAAERGSLTVGLSTTEPSKTGAYSMSTRVTKTSLPQIVTVEEIEPEEVKDTRNDVVSSGSVRMTRERGSPGSTASYNTVETELPNIPLVTS